MELGDARHDRGEAHPPFVGTVRANLRLKLRGPLPITGPHGAFRPHVLDGFPYPGPARAGARADPVPAPRGALARGHRPVLPPLAGGPLVLQRRPVRGRPDRGARAARRRRPRDPHLELHGRADRRAARRLRHAHGRAPGGAHLLLHLHRDRLRDRVGRLRAGVRRHRRRPLASRPRAAGRRAGRQPRPRRGRARVHRLRDPAPRRRPLRLARAVRRGRRPARHRLGPRLRRGRRGRRADGRHGRARGLLLPRHQAVRHRRGRRRAHARHGARRARAPARELRAGARHAHQRRRRHQRQDVRAARRHRPGGARAARSGDRQAPGARALPDAPSPPATA